MRVEDLVEEVFHEPFGDVRTHDVLPVSLLFPDTFADLGGQGSNHEMKLIKPLYVFKIR